MTGKRRTHWEDYAKCWNQLGPPLRPSVVDVQHFGAAIRRWNDGRRKNGTTALILGVTPEIASMEWPAGTQIIGIDRSLGMVQGVWPLHGAHARYVGCGEWNRLPLATGSIDICIADGCFTSLKYPDGYRHVLSEISRALKPSGLFVSRFFAQSNVSETTDHVLKELRTGTIETFHEFKFRLAIALQTETRAGVGVDAIWRYWDNMRDEIAKMSAHLGWDADVFSTVEVYRASQARYSFPDLSELRAVFEPHFAELSCHHPGYAFGSHCPTFSLSRKD